MTFRALKRALKKGAHLVILEDAPDLTRRPKADNAHLFEAWRKLGSRRDKVYTKQQFAAQEALLLMTDLAHNLLAWLHPWMLAETRFAKMGPVTLVNDVLCLPGEIMLTGDQLHRVALWETHPYATEMQVCLSKLLAHFGNP